MNKTLGTYLIVFQGSTFLPLIFLKNYVTGLVQFSESMLLN